MSTLATMPTQTPEADAIQHQHNKFIYPEFAGWAGERYLKKLLRQILPMALYRTWEIFVEHQANGNECYLGVSQLAAIAGRTSRTMQKNLAELEARQLLIVRAERKVFAGPGGATTSRAVVVKDFSHLYALAHEYHEWLNAADYLAPVRELRTLIAQDSRLVAKLRRFDNYRRVLYHQLPGPPKAREEDRWFTAYPVEEIFLETTENRATALSEAHPARMAKKQMAKELAKQLPKDSPERITVTYEKDHPKEDSRDSGAPFSETTWKKRGGTPACPARTREQEQAPDARQEVLEGTGPHLLAASPSTPPLQHGEQSSRHDAVKTHREGHLVTGEQGKPAHLQEKRGQLSQKRSSPPDHPLARSFVQELSALFGDGNPKGSLTRVLSLLASAHLSHPAEVLPCLVRAYTVARDTRTIRAEHWDARTGRVNRMPLFCAMVARLVQAYAQAQRWHYTWQQMEEDIAADDHLRLWWHQQQGQNRALAGIHAEAQEGAPSLQGDSSCPPAPQKTKHRLSVVLARQRSRPRLSQTDEEREARAIAARMVLTHLARSCVAMDEPVIWWEHLACGCPLYHKREGKVMCALCFPHPAWPAEVRALIASTVETSGGGEKSRVNSCEKRSDRTLLPKTGRWTKREEASLSGARVLEMLASSG